MGLKIITQIGTDRGITDEAYVRIADYQVSKRGNTVNFRIELFQKKSDSIIDPMGYSYNFNECRNQQIGDNFSVSLFKQVTEKITVQRPFPVEVTKTIKVPGPVDENGNTTLIDNTIRTMETEIRDVEEDVIKNVLDLTELENKSIFEFGYEKLKEKLITLFGDENIIDD